MNLEDYEIEVFDINGKEIPFGLDDKGIYFRLERNHSLLNLYKENKLIQLIVR